MRDAARGAVAAGLFFLLILPYARVVSAGSPWDVPATVFYVLVVAVLSLVFAEWGGEPIRLAFAVFVVVTFLTSAQRALSPSADTPAEQWVPIVGRLAARLEDAPSVRSVVARDIYYIVLDGLGRPDVLSRRFGVDSSRMVRTLRDLGVVIPDRARSNYSQTYLSLASSLNGDYLDDLARAMGDDRDRRPLARMIQESGALKRLKAAGYRFVMIGSSDAVTGEHRLADVCHCALPKGPNELEYALLSRSPFRVTPIDRFALFAHRRHVQDTWALLDQDHSAGRTFVFVHVLSPHPPFVFAADGRPRYSQQQYSFNDGDIFPGTQEEYRTGYAAQAGYVMSQVQRLFVRLLQKNEPMVVVVQSDHGSGLGMVNTSAEQTDAEERLAIFSAYFASPTAGRIPNDMSPVNALRWAMNAAIGTELALLPNPSFVSAYKRPYAFVEVPAEVP